MGVSSGIQQTVYIEKTADETINNSAALQDDDALILPVGTSETWFFETVVRYSSNATADIRFGWSGPTGATMEWGRGHVATSSGPGINSLGGSGTPTALSAIGDTLNLAGVASGSVHIMLAGWIFTDSTAGSVTLRWRQDTADVSDTKVLKGSFIRARKII